MNWLVFFRKVGFLGSNWPMKKIHNHKPQNQQPEDVDSAFLLHAI